MKTNCTLIKVALFSLFILILHTSVLAQTKYDFRNSSKISGTDRQVGALYRFPNVRAGVDALVTITAITGGLTINTLDATSSGFAEAFQPTITLPAHSKGYAEFSIVFVTNGTSTPLTQSEIPVTPIDVDGQSGQVYEYDEIFRSSSSYVDYNLLGNELNISYPSTNKVVGTNTAGIDYPSIDTTAKQVMFTVVNANTTTLVIRTGADNRSNSSQQRLRSLYFQKFNYPNSILAMLDNPGQQSGASASNAHKVKVYPSVFQNNINVNINAEKSGKAIIRIIDYSGRLVKEEFITAQKGITNIIVNNLDRVPPGNYILSVNFDNRVINQKVIRL